jgi:outer membrane protein assembly factor BamB
VDYSIYLTPSALGFTNNFLLNNNLAVGNVGSIGIFNILNKNINTTIIYNNSFGEIKWWNNSVIDNSNSGMLSPISYPGIINIVDNFVSMDSTLNSELNISANVTLYNIGNRGFYRPSILKNGAVCTDCWNYTSLSASTVIFRVSSWSNYSIGNYSNISLIINFVNFTDVSGSNFTTKNFIRVNVSVSVSNFFNVTINLYNSVRSLIRTKLFDYNMLTGWNSSLNRAVNNSLDIDNLDILWNYSMPSEVINSPLVVEDRIYICSFNALSPYTSLYALNATNGSILWRSLCGSNPDYYSVAYSNGIIYLPYYDGTSTLFARNATNGTQIWNATIDGRIFDYSTPAVSDGRVYINSMNNLTYALNATNGSILWNYTSPGTVYSGPAVYDGKIFLIANDGKTYALNATNGTQIWNYSFGLRFGVFSNSLRYSSVFAAEGYAYFGDLDNGTFYALNATNGSLIWSNNYFDNFLEFSTSVAFKGVVYFLDISGIIFAANATNGSLIWNYSLGEAVWYSNPTIAGDLLFIGSNAGRLYAINITNGSRAWSYVTSGGIYSSPAIADGKVFIGSNDKKLYAFGSSEYKMTFPNLPNGLYFFNATSCDSYGFCNYTETRNITIDYHFCGDGVCDSNENCGSCSSDCGVCPSTFVSGVSGGAGGGALTQKPSLRIDVPHPITLESIGPVEFNITLENDGSFNFNKVFLEGNLLENSESVASSVKFIPDNLAVFSIKKKETIAVSTYVYNEEIAVYEVVINASSKSPVYHTQAKVYLTFVGKNGSGVAKIVAFTEGLIDQNAECIELSPMIVDAKRLLESGEWKSGLEKTQLALEACKKILEGPKKASSRILSQEGKLVLYLVGAIIGAIVFAVFFNLYKLWKFRKLNNSLKGLSYSL